MKPLDGVRILDLTRLLPGPFCTQLLADLGADVIKIEDPVGGDYLRHTPPLLEDGTSALFHALNRGKRSVTLNLKEANDRTLFLALVDSADVVVESFRPGVMDRLGVGPEALRTRKSSLIYCAISGYGQTGPLRHRAGHDINYVARAGAFALMRTPTLLPVQIADLAGGAWPAAMQICAALVGRHRHGEGATIDVDMRATVAGLLSMLYARIAAGESIEGGEDLLIGKVPCYDLYPTADGHVAVGALEPKFWTAVCSVLERPDLLDRGYDQGAAGDEVRGILRGIFSAATTARWVERFADADACVEPVLAPSALLQEEARLRLDVGGTVFPVVPLGLGFSGVEAQTRVAPGLGADNDTVLTPLRTPGAPDGPQKR